MSERGTLRRMPYGRVEREFCGHAVTKLGCPPSSEVVEERKEGETVQKMGFEIGRQLCGTGSLLAR